MAGAQVHATHCRKLMRAVPVRLQEEMFSRSWISGLMEALLVQIQRLQRHATYGHLKQLVLQIIADDVIDIGHGPTHMIDTLRLAVLLCCISEPEFSIPLQMYLAIPHSHEAGCQWLSGILGGQLIRSVPPQGIVSEAGFRYVRGY